MALHTMAIRAAAAGVSLCPCPSALASSPWVWFSLTGGSASSVRAVRAWVRRRVFSFVLCAARGQRVLAGTEWTLCAPAGCASLLAWAPFGEAARALVSDSSNRPRACVRPQPFLHCARTCCSQRALVRLFLVVVLLGFRGGGLRRRVARSVALRVVDSPFGRVRGSAGYLVDPASSHMLVSKIKPCMSKYKRLVL